MKDNVTQPYLFDKGKKYFVLMRMKTKLAYMIILEQIVSFRFFTNAWRLKEDWNLLLLSRNMHI